MTEEFNSKDEMQDDLTRRQWLLRLGEMVALAGISGLVPDAAIAALQSAPSSAVALPPGLYDPSEEHLVHALASAKFTPPLGSETDFVQPKAPYALQFFSPEEFRVITRFIEIMLGDVDKASLSQTANWLDLYLHTSAGVRDAAQHLDPLHRILAVEFFGEDSVRKLEAFDPATIVREGLKSLNELSVNQHRVSFLDLTPPQQSVVVQASATEAAKPAAKNLFEILRRESTRGYYTTAKGLEDLDYQGNAFYPECPGCQGNS